jgi:Peptidyl-tRNA hydrolase PTH2
MYLVVRRGAFEDLSRAGELVGAAAVDCVRAFAGEPELEEWRPRPGKVVLRARGGQWRELLESEERTVVIEDAVAALPPRRRSQRGPLLERMQAMTTALEPPPERVDPDPERVTYLVNPRLDMSSGKTLAQIAHAAVIAADGGTVEDWVAAGCPAHVAAPPQPVFDALCTSGSDALAARVVDGGLTEVAPGTVTVLALPPGSPVATVDR